MPVFIATPFTQNMSNPGMDQVHNMLHASADEHLVLARDEYDERPALPVEADGEHAALKRVWMRWQTIEDNDGEIAQTTPDNGPDLQTGDLVRLRVQGESADPTWWICCPFGWARTGAPGANGRHTSTHIELSSDGSVEVLVPASDDDVSTLRDDMQLASDKLGLSFLLLSGFGSTPRCDEELKAIPPAARDAVSHTGRAILRGQPKSIATILSALRADAALQCVQPGALNISYVHAAPDAFSEGSLAS